MNKNIHAYPLTFIDESGWRSYQRGMSLRDYFAAHALQGMLSHSGSYSTIAEEAYELADKMMQARGK